MLVVGVFPNGCCKWATAEVKQGICTMMLVSFTKEVDLGLLKASQHIVRVINSDGTIFEKQFARGS